MADAHIKIRPGFAELRREAAARGIPLVVFSAGLGNVVKEVLRQCVEQGEQLPVVSNWLRFAPCGGNACAVDEPLVHMCAHAASNLRPTDPCTAHSPPGRPPSLNPFPQPHLPGPHLPEPSSPDPPPRTHLPEPSFPDPPRRFNKDGARLLEQLGEEEWRAVSRGRDTALLLGDGLGDCTMADGLGMRAIARLGFLNELTREGQQSRLPKYAAAFDAVVLADGPMDWLLLLLFGARR